MDSASADRGGVARSLIIWAAALLAGIVVAWIVGGLFGLGAAPGLVFGAAVFLVLPYLVPSGAGAGAVEAVRYRIPEPSHPDSVGHSATPPEAVIPEVRPADPAQAPVARFAEVEDLAPEPVVAPPVEAQAAEVAPAMSERVRDAAKAAGEAARAATGAVSAGSRPASLEEPRGGAPDNLKRVRGIGPKFERILHDLGVYHFDQIASWGPDEIAWVDGNLDGFTGRVVREDWVGQAMILAGGGETEHSQRVDRGEST